MNSELFQRNAKVLSALHIPLLLCLLFTTTCGGLAYGQTEPNVKLLSVRKIWDAASHNAFTDLVRWQGKFYCAFREGQQHVGDQGKLRIISSTDGEAWKSAGLLSHPEFDLRDAAISITPDDRLMVLGGVQSNVQGTRKTGTFVSFSDDGERFTEPQVVIPPGRWLWRVTWHAGTAYGVAYGSPDNPQATSLLTTRDGIHYQVLAEEMLNDGERPTEARIRFDQDDTAYCLQRRDGRQLNSAMLGVSRPPYTEWAWHDLERRLGGPNFLQLPNGSWLAAGRLYDGGARTELLSLDIASASLTPLLRLPSGGDTSYPGMVWHDDALWLSYYSSHEQRTSIYLAKIAVEP